MAGKARSISRNPAPCGFVGWIRIQAILISCDLPRQDQWFIFLEISTEADEMKISPMTPWRGFCLAGDFG
jgi:hypothetical protein